MKRFCKGALACAVAAGLLVGSGARALAAETFSGNLSDTWFLVTGPMESRGTCWDSDEVSRMKQGMKLYVHLMDNDDGSYKSEVYSITADPQGKCWQMQGITGDKSQLPDYGGIQVFPSADRQDAFFVFFGHGISYIDPTSGNWSPVEHNQAVWGTVKLLKEATNKIRMEFRVVLQREDSGQSCVQMGQFKGMRVDPPTSICPTPASLNK